MSHRLQVLIPEDLESKIRKAAERRRVSKGEWVRQAIQDALARNKKGGADPVARLAQINAPTGGIDQMLAEIEQGTALKIFIDSNIPMYVAGGLHEHQAPARQFLDAVRRGEVEACTSTEVLQEILYRYCAISRRELAGEVYDLFVELCPEILDVTLADTDRARVLIGKNERASVRDAIHAAVMLNHGIKLVATFDAGFDSFAGIKRYPLVARGS